MWITNSLQADWMCVLANTSEGAAHKNKSLIMVPMTRPASPRAKKIRKIGMMAERHRADPLRRRSRCRKAIASARKAWASPTR
jgi:alkylation response protein AidB-like acyl-CoA dehydrogenase